MPIKHTKQILVSAGDALVDNLVEEWKPVFGYEGFYSVSNFGRIKREKIYHRDNKRKTMRVHKIVAESFLGFNSGFQVNHKDFNKLNNNVGNLEYVTAEQNTNHAIRMKGGIWGRIKKVS